VHQCSDYEYGIAEQALVEYYAAMSLNSKQIKFIRKNSDKMSDVAISRKLGISRKQVKRALMAQPESDNVEVIQETPKISQTHWMILGIILAAAFIAYSPGFSAPFIFDDEHHVIGNPVLWQDGGVRRVLTDPAAFSGRPDSRMYRPMALWSLQINYAISGINTQGYHITNVLIHLGVCLLLFLSLNYLRLRPEISLICVGIFALHPINSEPIIYISARSALLAALFVWGAILTFLRAREESEPNKVLWLVLSAVLFCLALLSKENAIVLVALIPIIELVRRGKTNAPQPWNLYAVYFGIAILYVLLRYSVLDLPTVDVVHADRTWLENLVTQASVFMRYLKLILIPIHQTVDYEIPKIHGLFDAGQAFWTKPFVGVIVGSGLIFWAGARIKKGGAAAIAGCGVLMAIISMAPESSIIALNQVANERRLYLPLSAGSIAIGCIWTIPWKKYHQILIPTAGVAALCLMIIVFGRANAWQSEISLWRAAAMVSPRSVSVRLGLGLAYSRSGREMPQGSERDHTLKLGVKELKRTISIRPNYQKAYSNLGITYIGLGQYNEAIYVLKKAIEINPNYDKAFSNLGAAYIDLDRWDEAEKMFNRALEISPEYVEAWSNLGIVVANRAMTEHDPKLVAKAIYCFDMAIKLNPNFSQARINKQRLLGMVEKSNIKNKQH